MAQRPRREPHQPGTVATSPPPHDGDVRPANSQRRPQLIQPEEQPVQGPEPREVERHLRPNRRQVVRVDSIRRRCQLGALLEAPRPPCPILDVRPIPNQGGVEVGNRLREIIMTTTPIMHHLRTSDAGQTPGNLRGADQLIRINLSSHEPTLALKQVPTDAQREADDDTRVIRTGRLCSLLLHDVRPPAGDEIPGRDPTPRVKCSLDSTSDRPSRGT